MTYRLRTELSIFSLFLYRFIGVYRYRTRFSFLPIPCAFLSLFPTFWRFFVLPFGRMLAACNVAAYASSICIYLLGLCPATTLVAILLSAPEGLSIARAFTPSLSWPRLLGGSTHSPEASEGRSDAQRPYRLERLVVRILKHAPCVVLAVFADAMAREAVAAGGAAVAAAQGGNYWGNWLSGVVGAMFFSPAAVRCLPLVPFLYMFFVAKPPPRPPSPPSSAPSSASGTPAASEGSRGVVVAGGGVGGLVLGACLQQLGLPFEVRVAASKVLVTLAG